MKVAVKILIDKQWRQLPAKNLKGRSIVDYMLGTKDTAMAAIFNKNDEPRIFVTNSDEWAAKYRNKGLCLTAKELKELIGTTILPPLVAEEFPDAEFLEIRNHEGREKTFR